MCAVAVEPNSKRIFSDLLDGMHGLWVSVFRDSLSWKGEFRSRCQSDAVDVRMPAYILVAGRLCGVVGSARLLLATGWNPPVLSPQLREPKRFPNGATTIDTSHLCLETSVKARPAEPALRYAGGGMFAAIFVSAMDSGYHELVLAILVRIGRIMRRTLCQMVRIGRTHVLFGVRPRDAISRGQVDPVKYVSTISPLRRAA